jgi:hypothetical protein
MRVESRLFRHALAWATASWAFALALLVLSQPPIGLPLSITLGHIFALSYTGPVYSILFLWGLTWRRVWRLATIAFALLAWVLIVHAAQRPLNLTGTIWNSAINMAAILFVAFAGRAVWHWYAASRALAAAEQLRTAAEQRALGAMLAPHTLHNMLNVVYAATLSSPDQAPALVIRLSEMMRYLVEKGQQDFVPVEEEWKFLEGYRDFALDRAASATIDLQFEGDEDTPVPALLLAGVFENAIKHGAGEAGELHVSAHFASTKTGFRFVVENRIGVALQPGTGMGMDLVQQRLALLYPGRHRYAATFDHDDIFRTEIATW